MGDRGPATSANLLFVAGIAADRQGNVYIAQQGAMVVRKVSPDGRITTFAGTGVSGFSGDGGPATRAQLSGPSDVAVDTGGNVYILEGNRVRKVSAAGTITTIAGTGVSGFSGDGGPAIRAQLEGALGVAATKAQIPSGWISADATGNVYFADSSVDRVRKISPGGTITRSPARASTARPGKAAPRPRRN